MDAYPTDATNGNLLNDGGLGAPESTSRRLNLALQGGGAHGSFTWGVLSRLLDSDAHLSIEDVSGSSSGAINAVVLGHMTQRTMQQEQLASAHEFKNFELLGMKDEASGHFLAKFCAGMSPLPLAEHCLGCRFPADGPSENRRCVTSWH